MLVVRCKETMTWVSCLVYSGDVVHGDEETSESSAEFPKAFSLSSKDMGGSTSGFSISRDNPHTGDTLALQVQYDLLGVF
ncbi:hypothetical protein WN944_014559 [Citrus x changshan-huyou]|uniref:Uncharacterized protein n=1 Tax=Citrus x changshan-huyou TaxID=2935761 RepID=A0AAP0QIU2_9ROSI